MILLEVGLHIFDRGAPTRVVCGEYWATQALAQDLVAGSDACGIEGGGEEGTLDLINWWLVMEIDG